MWEFMRSLIMRLLTITLVTYNCCRLYPLSVQAMLSKVLSRRCRLSVQLSHFGNDKDLCRGTEGKKWHVFLIDNFGSYRITCHENSVWRKRRLADLILFNMYYLSENNAPIIALKRVSFESDLEGIKEIIGLNRLKDGAYYCCCAYVLRISR